MTEGTEEVTLAPVLSTQEFGIILGCLTAAAERAGTPESQELYHELADKLRDAQWDMLGPMPVQKGMNVVNEILEKEKATLARLR